MCVASASLQCVPVTGLKTRISSPDKCSRRGSCHHVWMLSKSSSWGMDELPILLKVVKGMKIRVRIPATTANLGPGFDALGLALDLWNEAVFSSEAEPGEESTVRVEGEGAGELAQDGSNLILQAAGEVFQRAGEKVPA